MIHIDIVLIEGLGLAVDCPMVGGTVEVEVLVVE